jgi:hypothetical protein
LLLVGNSQEHVNSTMFNWTLFVNVEPISSTLPILIAFLIYLGIAVLWITTNKTYYRYQNMKKRMQIEEDQREDKPRIQNSYKEKLTR